MPRLVRFKLDGGGEVLVETDDGDAGALVARPGGVLEAPRSFQETLSALHPVAEAVIAQVTALAVVPAEITVELGVTLKAEAGVVIASTAAEGNLKLTLKWRPAG